MGSSQSLPRLVATRPFVSLVSTLRAESRRTRDRSTSGRSPHAEAARWERLDFAEIDDGDVALLKVNADNLPVVELQLDGDVAVGTEVISIGYPGSSDQVVDPTGPTFKDGRISSEKTRGNGLLPVYEISAAVSGGMSGGPTVDLRGQVVGLNSFKILGEDQQFNFISPTSLIQEMLDRNGIDVELSDTDSTYRLALANLGHGSCIEAVDGFEQVVNTWPDHEDAKDHLREARGCVEDMPVDEPAPTSTTVPSDDRNEDTDPPVAGGTGVPPQAMAFAAAAWGGAGFLLARNRRPKGVLTAS